MSIRFRAATPADLDTLVAIEERVFGSDAWSPGQLAEELRGPYRNYIVLLGQLPGADEAAPEQVLGYAGLFHPGTVADVQTIAVDAAARGRGWGRALMRELIAIARGAGAEEIFLEVRADNPVARGLYEDLGFTEIGRRPRYYQPDGVDAIVMRLELAPAPAAPGPIGQEAITPPTTDPDETQEPSA